jgi:hypothetical protein
MVTVNFCVDAELKVIAIELLDAVLESMAVLVILVEDLTLEVLTSEETVIEVLLLSGYVAIEVSTEV